MNNTNYFSKKLLIASTALLGFSTMAQAKQKQQPKQPNILFILTDDQDFASLGAYGDTECETPNLDRLAKQGVTFTGAHQMGSFLGAVSTASRTMIMTGRNVWQAQELRKKQTKYEKGSGNADIVPKDAPEYYSMPAVFHRAGYETFRTCKKGNSYTPANVLFDQVFDKTTRGNTDEKGSKWHADKVIKYLDDRTADNSDSKKPFLVYLGFSHPHDPRHGKPELLEKYGAQDIDHPTVVNDKMPSLPINWLPEKPFHDGHLDLRDETKVSGVMDRRDEATIRNEKGKEFACIENIDIQIGRVLEALEKTGELDNTYIIFTADHGIAVGKHAFMGKQSLYEHCYRVPFIVTGPNVKKDAHKTGNIYLMDLLPTFCDFAGIDIPEICDGQSFKAVAEGKKETIRETTYGVYCGGSKPGMRCVKSGDWKLIKYDVLDGKVRETQLFNLKENPNELMIEHHAPEVIAKLGNTPEAYQVDLAEDPKYKKKLTEMEALLLKQMEELGDPYRLWDQPQIK